MIEHRPWAPHHVITGEAVSSITTQGYRRFWAELGLKMEPTQFAELGRRVAAAEEVTKIILTMMDLAPNVLGPDETEDKP